MKKLIPLILLVTMLVTTIAPVTFAEESSTESGITVVDVGFTDVPMDHDYNAAISLLKEKGVLNGYSDGSFKPENSINRAEVLKVIFVGSAIALPEEMGELTFEDVASDVWFAPFVAKGYELGIVKGDGVDGLFHGERGVNKAEFLKMLLEANQIKQEILDSISPVGANDVPEDSWYASYMNYAASVGVIELNEYGNLDPGMSLNRGEVAQMMYLLMLIKGKYNTQFLLEAAEVEMVQIDVFVGAGKIDKAKKASELSVDLTQQAMVNFPSDNMVLGVAKLAKAYDYLMEAYIAGAIGEDAGAADWANQAIGKAGEAWEADNDTEIVARHIKEVARSILVQVGGEEV